MKQVNHLMKFNIEISPIQTGNKVIVTPIFDEPIKIEEFVHVDDTFYNSVADGQALVRMDEYDQPQQVKIAGSKPGEKIFIELTG